MLELYIVSRCFIVYLPFFGSWCIFVWVIHDRGRYIIFYMFLVSHCLLIYIYELFMIYVFILCYVKSRIYFLFTYVFYTCVYAFVECFRKYTGWFICAAVYTCNWWIVVKLDFFFFVMGFIVCKWLFPCNFEHCVYVLSRIAKGGVC